VASEDWDWADAWGCYVAPLRAGVSVSVYVDACAFYGVVVDCQGFVVGFLPLAVIFGWVLAVLGFALGLFACVALGFWLPMALGFS
jgi:hypothetical protein